MGKQNQIFFIEAKLMPTLTGSFDMREPLEAQIWFINEKIQSWVETGDRVLMVEQSRQVLQRWDETLFCTCLIRGSTTPAVTCDLLRAEPQQVAKLFADFTWEAQSQVMALPVFLKEGSPSEPQNTENYLSNYTFLRSTRNLGGGRFTTYNGYLSEEALILPGKPGW